MERIDELKKRLKASEGEPGYSGRVAMLKVEIADLEAKAARKETKAERMAAATAKPKKRSRHRSADNGKFVTKTTAKADPKGTVKETR